MYKRNIANWSLERQLASGTLAEMAENFKGYTIQSTISNYAQSDSNKQVDEINDSDEQVGAKNWSRNYSVGQVDQINDSDKQVGAISDSEKLVVTGSDPKSDQGRNPKVATHTTNRKFTQNY